MLLKTNQRNKNRKSCDPQSDELDDDLNEIYEGDILYSRQYFLAIVLYRFGQYFVLTDQYLNPFGQYFIIFCPLS